jgi:hypothetical protein
MNYTNERELFEVDYYKSKVFGNSWCNEKEVISSLEDPFTSSTLGKTMYFDNITKLVNMRFDGEHLGIYQLNGIKCRETCAVTSLT